MSIPDGIAQSIRELPTSYLDPIAAGALQEDNASALPGWDAELMSVLSVGAGTVALIRCSGTAQIATGSCRWSAIVKVVRPGAPNRFGGVELSSPEMTEIETYQSDLFARREGPFRGARCFLVDQREDGVYWLWIEDLSDYSGAGWSADQYLGAARGIGQFRGSWLREETGDIGRLLRNGVLNNLSTQPVLVDMQNALLQESQSEYVREGLPGPLYDTALELRASIPSLVHAALKLPVTLAHNDCHIRNLFTSSVEAPEPEIVAIDFAQVGVEHLGVDAGGLFGSGFMWTDQEAIALMDMADGFYSAWLDGLRSTGWTGAGEVARLGFLVPLLRPTIRTAGMLAFVSQGMQFPLQRYGGNKDDMPASFRRRFEFLVPFCDEALILARQIG